MLVLHSQVAGRNVDSDTAKGGVGGEEFRRACAFYFTTGNLKSYEKWHFFNHTLHFFLVSAYNTIIHNKLSNKIYGILYLWLSCWEYNL